MESVSRARAEGVPRWTDSTIRGRGEILEELHELASSPGEIPRLVVLEGPRGAGTSTLAGELVDQVKRTWRLSAREDPVVVHVDVSSLNHTKGDPSRGVATAILDRFNQGVQVQGSSTGRVVWWALRRIAVQSKPVVVWLDQVHEGTQTLAEVMEPLLEPERVMETGFHLPPFLVVVSGRGKANLGSWPDAVPTKWIHVPLLPRAVLEEVVLDRARSLGCEISLGAVSKVLDIMVTRGRGLSILAEVLQAAEKPGRAITQASISTPRVRARGKADRQALEVRVLEIIRGAGGQLTMGELMEQVTRDLTQKGEAHRAASSVRRLTVRLEQLGLVERQVTLGGEGGTRSTLSLPGHPSPR
ncbi:MAG: hypothetical protein JRN35_09060 [Nitrososphaerota archaeon]|nr:hypothetical protein [Nitrososphaerota archaeon]